MTPAEQARLAAAEQNLYDAVRSMRELVAIVRDVILELTERLP